MTTTTMPEETENTTLKKGPENNLQRGEYKLVGWDMDTTGKKPTDEICQIAGYTPDTQYSQYVMPYKDLSRTAKIRYALKVITISKFRMLKDTKLNKIIKTKSEVSALTEFVDWLKNIKGSSDGVFLVYHENRQVLPVILLENLKKYEKIYEQFNEVVKGFVNSCDIAKANGKGTNCFSMRTLARNFFNKNIEEFETNASFRAKLALEIIEHFITMPNETSPEPKNIAKTDATEIFDYICNYVQTIKEEEVIRAELKAVNEREITLAPIFADLFVSSKRERQQVAPLRRLLAESEIEYAQLEEAWKENKRDGVEQLINNKIKSVSPKGLQKLLCILECYFDEEKASELKLELEKKPKYIKKKKQRATKKLDTTNNIDSGNDSGDNTLTQSPTKLEVPDSNENQIGIVA